MTEVTVTEALNMDDDEFDDLLRSQMNRAERGPLTWVTLSSPEVYTRTEAMLRVMISRSSRVVEQKHSRLATLRKSDEHYAERHASYQATRRYLARLKEFASEARYAALQQRQQLKAARVAAYAPPAPERPVRTEDDVRRALPALRRLTAALIDHEDEMYDDASEADEELWDLLDEITIVIESKSCTLRKAHEMHWSAPTETTDKETPRA